MTALDIRAVAIQLSVSRKLVRSLIDRGELEAFRVGRLIRVSPAALEAYRQANRVMCSAPVVIEAPRRRAPAGRLARILSGDEDQDDR